MTPDYERIANLDGYSYHEKMKMIGASEPMIAGIDILDDAGYLNEGRLKLLLACEQTGQDPEAMARHLVKLCRVASEYKRN